MIEFATSEPETVSMWRFLVRIVLIVHTVSTIGLAQTSDQSSFNNPYRSLRRAS